MSKLLNNHTRFIRILEIPMNRKLQSVNDSKKLKRVLEVIPFDCWGMIVMFLGGFEEFKILILSIKGFYEYTKYQNSFFTKNICFKLVDFPKKKNDLNHVKHIQVGNSIKSSLFNSRISERVKDSTCGGFLNRIFRSFRKLESVTYNSTYFPQRLGKIVEIGKTLTEDVQHLKKLRIIIPKELCLNLYTDKLSFLESLTMKYPKKPETASYKRYRIRQRSMNLSFFVYGKDEILPNLKRLSISNYRNVTMNPHLLPILSQKLRILKIVDSYCPFEEISSKFFPNLTNLELYCLIKVKKDIGDDDGLEIKNLPNLVSLEVFQGSDEVKIDIATISKNLETLNLRYVCIKDTRVIRNMTKLRNLYLDVMERKSTFVWGTGQAYYDFRIDAFPQTLTNLRVSSSYANCRLKNINQGVKRLELKIDEILEIEFNEIKPFVEYLSIECIKKEPPTDENLKIFTGFAELKELVIKQPVMLSLAVKNNLNLKKLSIFSDNMTWYITGGDENSQRVMISNLPILSTLIIEDGINHINVRKCPNLRKLSLKECKKFPKGLKRENLEELIIQECSENLLSNKLTKRSIDGKVFKSLKYLSISQNWNVQRKKSANGESVKRIIGLDKLWSLHIRSNIIEKCGIDVIDGISRHVNVVLNYRKNKVDRSMRYFQRSMDKKRFYEMFPLFSTPFQ